MTTLALQTSPNLPVSTIQQKLFLERVVAFGDAEDLLNDEVIKNDEGAFIVDVRRQFMPGNYVMHIVGPDTTLNKKFASSNSAILCREDVDPKLIHALLIDSNCDREIHPAPTKNFISRWDWMNFRNYFRSNDDVADEWTSYDDDEWTTLSDEDFDGSAESNEDTPKKKLKDTLKEHFKCNIRDLTFFVNARRIDDIIAGRFTIKRDSKSIFVMMNNTLPEPVIGFAINTRSDAHSFNVGVWNYACVLTDQNSKQNFAFIFGDLYVLKYRLRKDRTTVEHDVQKGLFTYNIENFLYKN